VVGGGRKIRNNGYATDGFAPVRGGGVAAALRFIQEYGVWERRPGANRLLRGRPAWVFSGGRVGKLVGVAAELAQPAFAVSVVSGVHLALASSC